MRKRSFYVGMLTCALAFSACQKDAVISGGDAGTEIPGIGKDDQVLVLSTAGGADNSGRSRATVDAEWFIGDRGAINNSGRPLFSSEMKQDIQHITLYFVSKAKAGASTAEAGKIVLVKEIDYNTWKESVKYKNGRQLLVPLKKEKRETLDGKFDYDVYAVGYSHPKAVAHWNLKGYDFNTALSVGTEFKEEGFWAKINAMNARNDAEEIFAGKLGITVTEDNELAPLNATKDDDGYNDDKENTPNLCLYRQVAGISGYFTNIPAKIGEHVPTHIRLIARAKNTQVNFGMLDTNVGEDSGSKKVNYVINGSMPSTEEKVDFYGEGATGQGFVVYEINLSKWFPQGFENSDLNEDGFVGFADAKKAQESGDLFGFWKNPNACVNGNVQSLVSGSVWGGKFVIPFELSSGKYTLQLQLIEKSETAPTSILRSWNITVDKVNKETQEESSTGIISIGKQDESEYIYNIYRNHMYSIGKKSWDNGNGPTDPVDPTDPNHPLIPIIPIIPEPGGPDNPTDLSKGQDLIINVNTMWEADHDMGID